MTREWPSVGLLPTEKGKQFFSSAPPHKFHTVMKNVAVWNIALRLTVTQLISVLVPSLRLYSSTKIWCGAHMEMLSFKNLFLLRLQDNMCSYLYFSTLQTYWVKNPSRKNDWSSFHLGSCRCNLYTSKYTVYPTPDTTLYLYYILQYNYTKQKYLPMFWPLTSTLWR